MWLRNTQITSQYQNYIVGINIIISFTNTHNIYYIIIIISINAISNYRYLSK